MDDGSQQAPSDIWFSCQHVSVSLLCSGKPHNSTHACQISHSAQFRTLMELVFIKQTHPHIHIDAHPHRHTRIQNGLIVIQAIVVPFSHASQTTVKTHSNRLRLRHTTPQYRCDRDVRHRWQRVDLQRLQLFDPTNSNIHSYFKIKESNLLSDLIFTYKETCILLSCCPSENDMSATSIPFQFPLLHKMVTGDHFNSYFSRGNGFNRPCWGPDTSKIDLSLFLQRPLSAFFWFLFKHND